jgi:hypothetical protein
MDKMFNYLKILENSRPMGPAIPESAPGGFILETQAVEDLREDLARLVLSAVHNKKSSGPELLKPEELMPKEEVEADLESVLSKHAGWVIRGFGKDSNDLRNMWACETRYHHNHSFGSMQIRYERDDIAHLDFHPQIAGGFATNVLIVPPDPVLGFQGHFVSSLEDLKLFATDLNKIQDWIFPPECKAAIDTVVQSRLSHGIADEAFIKAAWEIRLFFKKMHASISHTHQQVFMSLAKTLQRITLTSQDLYIFDNRRLAHGRIRDEARGPIFIIE